MRPEICTLVTLTLLAASASTQDQATPFRGAQLVGGAYHRFDLTVDLDLDGHVDYLGGWDTNVHWHKNLGNGLVASSHVLLTSNFAQWANFCSTDLDNDGFADAVCFAGDQVLAILARPGGPVVHTTTISAHATTPQLADLQGDGEPEFVVSSVNGIQAYEFHPSSNSFQLVFTEFSPNYQHFIADLDGNGTDEIWRYNATWISVMDIDPTWNVAQNTLLPNTISPEIMATVGDVDGDGDTDLVLFENDFNGPSYVLFRRDASGQLVQEPAVVGGPATHLGDVDGDGDLDGLCCGGGTGPFPNNARSDYMISFNDGSGYFAPARAVKGLGARQLAGCVDVDGDGDRDLVAGRAVIFNPGDILDVFPMPGGHAARYEPLADADRDLDADLNLGGNSSWFSWMEGRGDGSFVQNFAVIANPSAFIQSTGLVGDFDGDGDVDGLLEDRSVTPVQVRLYRNFGGVFGIALNAAAPGVSMLQTSNGYGGNGISWANHWSFASDWDADGDLDCVVVDESSGWTRLFENNGAGYFTPGPTLATGVMVTGVADFNGDGHPDLLAGTGGDLSTLHYLPGTSPGFGTPVLISNTVQRDERPGIVDIDADGDLDILSSTQTGGALFRNQGAGSFVQEPQAFASYRLTQWSFGDVDNNGTLDAVSRRPYFDGGRTSAVILQNADGTFASPIIMIAAVSGIIDTDWDGDLDLVGDDTVMNHTATGSFGKLRQYGNGTPGTLSVRPRINDIGITAPGNPMMMRVSGMRGGAPGLWVLGIGEASFSNNPLPGLTLYVDQLLAVTPFVADGFPGAGGEGTWTLPWQMITGLGGLELSSQAFCLDPMAAQGWTQTNGKVMTLPY